MTADRPTFAFIYDRHATTNQILLQIRLEMCADYVNRQRWGFGGWFVDRGEDALTLHRRPAFRHLCNTMRAAGTEKRRVCLVFHWDRFAHDREARGVMTRRVLALGGWVETCDGERRTPDGQYLQTGSPITGPLTT